MPSAEPASRYRRRILSIGAIATGALYVVGAPIFVNRIEADLEERVPVELAELGFDGVTADFTGQSGTLSCVAPLDDPEAARAAAFEVRGVRTVELDRTCRVRTQADDDAARADVAPSTATSSSGSTATTPPSDGADGSSPTTPTTDVQQPTIREMVGANPDLAFLAVLLDEVDLPDPTEPVTLFAPSNDAFDAMPAEALGALQSNPDLLELVLLHHIVDGAILADDLPAGEVETLAEGPVLVGRDGDVVTVDGNRLVDVDMLASDGVLHVVDGVLVPPAVELAAAAALKRAVAEFDGVGIRLGGVVASEVERAVLVDAAVAAIGAADVADELVTDPDTGLGSAEAATLAAMTSAMATTLSNGEVGFEAGEFFARGEAPTAEAAAAFADVTRPFGVEADVESPPPASDDAAAELEEALNAFVLANPIQFAPGSTLLAPEAAGVLDRVAADARSLAGVEITVEGHTDSDGGGAANLQLSRARAEAVRQELIARGLAETVIEAVGYGSEQPVLVDGVEDKAASRRVEFRVVASE